MKQKFVLRTQAGAWTTSPDKMPSAKGIYFVYRCTFERDNLGKIVSSRLSKLLYIGESHDMHIRIWQHNDADDVRTSDIPKEEPLFYTCAIFDRDEEIRKRVEAALIYYHRKILPPEVGNKKNTKTFDYDETEIQLEGDYFMSLTTHFIQERVTKPE